MYRDEQECEGDFYPDECFAAGARGLWTPWLSGFSLTRRASLDPDSRPSTTLYFSEPLYRERDDQGGSHLTTLLEKLRAGQHFEHTVSRHSEIKPGSALSDLRLKRAFEPQRVFESAVAW